MHFTGEDGGREAPITVTVVIPTTGRQSLSNAVESVLSQSFSGHIDLVVSADTERPLDLPDDDRIRVVRVGPAAGGNVARQAGIDIARGSLVALLDDDDAWLPHKLEHQLADVFATVSDPFVEPWLSVTSATVNRKDGPTTWPRTPIQPNEDFREYMFRLRSFRMGGSFIQSSSFLFPRRVARQGVRFSPTQRIHQDWQWVLDFRDRFPDAPILQMPDPLIEYRAGVSSVSNNFLVQDSIDFGMERLSDSSRLLADFLMTFPVERASLTSDHATIRKLVRVSFRAGIPTRYALTRAAVRYLQSLYRSRKLRNTAIDNSFDCDDLLPRRQWTGRNAS